MARRDIKLQKFLVILQAKAKKDEIRAKSEEKWRFIWTNDK